MSAQAERARQTVTAPPISIITCPQWGARAPLADPEPCGKAFRIIFHHTASHLRQINNPADESYEEACRYFRDIQGFHMRPPSAGGRGWNDTGQNFTVTRGGHIGQGRWGTVSQIQNGRMVVSAHCPGFNTQIGIEHEHIGSEAMTDAQREASALLMAWIAAKYQRKTVLPVDPHSAHFATACPANLKAEIPAIRERAQQILADV